MEQTIAAIATAYGEGGIGIVRISGPKAKQIMDKIFFPAKKEAITNRKLTYGEIRDPQTGNKIDEVLAVFMKGPKTYTAEDTAEINCHGSMVSLTRVLEIALETGAVLAEPGEFTKRAFLNGRLDLSQAEAVIDLIKAKTDKGFDVALDQLSGGLSDSVKEIREELMNVLVELAVNIDYPDEDIVELTYDKLIMHISKIGDIIESLICTADTGRIIQDGLDAVIIGKPNVGKSSLMNCLLKTRRAIVTEIPGTTRDTIEEIVRINQIPIRLTDTAGIHETDDRIEQIGIEKSKSSFNKADLIIFVLDGHQGMTDEDMEIIEYIKNKKAIVLINKMDLNQLISAGQVRKYLPDAAIIQTSVKGNIGIDKIEKEITDMVYDGRVKQNDSLLVTNVRHKELLVSARKCLIDAFNMAENGGALDFIEVDIRDANDYLGQIIGEMVTDDVIDQVFARFCLGK